MRFWPKRKTEERGSYEDPSVPISSKAILAFLGGGESGSLSGEAVSPDTALKVPAIWGAVNFLSSTIAGLPLKAYRKANDSRDEITGGVSSLLHDAPNAEWTSFRWRKYSMVNTLLRGRALTFIERDAANRVIALWPINPAEVTIRRSGGRTYYVRGKNTYEAGEILDIPFMLDADMIGAVSPVDKLRDCIGLCLALQSYAARHFAKGGVPPLALQGPGMSPAAASRAADDIKDAITKANAEGRLAVAIPEGYELKPLGFNPEQSQLEEARRFQLQEVARIYSMPPAFLQDLSHATFSNVEQQDLHLVKHTLNTWLNAWEQEMNLKLFPNDNKRFVEFNLDGLLRGDFKTRMDGYAQGVQNGLITPNEARAKENRPAMDGGNKLFIQQNMSDMKDLNKEQTTPDGTNDED